MDQPSQPFDLSVSAVGLDHAGGSFVEAASGPDPVIDGFVVSAPNMTVAPPHGGERHLDGAELLVLISGSVTVILEEDNAERSSDLSPGQGFLVPPSVWHRVEINQPSQLLYITPGPNSEHRPGVAT